MEPIEFSQWEVNLVVSVSPAGMELGASAICVTGVLLRIGKVWHR